MSRRRHRCRHSAAEVTQIHAKHTAVKPPTRRVGGEEIVGARRHARAAGMLALVRTLRRGGVQAMAAIRMGPGHCSFQKEKESKSRKSAGRAGPSRPCYSFLIHTRCGRRRKSRQGASTRSAPRANTLVELRHRVSLFAAVHPHGACKPAPAMACATVAAGSPNEVRGARGPRPTLQGSWPRRTRLVAYPPADHSHAARGPPSQGVWSTRTWPMAYSLRASDPFARCSWPAFSGRSVHSHTAHGAPSQRSWPTLARGSWPTRAGLSVHSHTARGAPSQCPWPFLSHAARGLPV